MKSQTSFWQLLDEHSIVIPIIQRDYAQGRRGNGMNRLRNRLLEVLRKALDTPEQPANLDFIYGSIDENSNFLPLDGQQRLTTLWLLHWLIAFRAGKLHIKDVRKRLLNFTYNTRHSAKQFCRQLVEQFAQVDAASVTDDSIASYIRTRNWYYYTYNNDPTIQAMLVMLAGDKYTTPYPDKNGLTQFFPRDNTPFKDYWEKLVSTNCPILLYYTSITMTDELYIKMNARGKPLTPFERFKAELVEYETEKEGKYLNLMTDYDFISNLDNSWLQFFWRESKHETPVYVDEVYFRFFRLYMRALYLLHVKIADKRNTTTYTILVKEVDNNCFYKIEDYDEVLEANVQFKKRFSDTLNSIVKYNELIGGNINQHIRDISDFQAPFLPEYNETQKSVSTLTHRDKALFFGICLFFEKYPIEKTETETINTHLKDWIRFCYNICCNPLIDTPEAESGAIGLLNQLAQDGHCRSIYERLSEAKDSPTVQAAKEQMEEEWHKARFQAQKHELKTKFAEAERHSFFQGSIRFLLWNENGEYTDEYFERKYKNAQTLFPQEKQYSTEKRIDDCKPFQYYFIACDKLNMILSNDTSENHTIRFDGHGYSWKMMLNNKDFASTTHTFLMQTAKDAEDSLKKAKEAKELLKSILPRLNWEDLEQDQDQIKCLEYVAEVVLEDHFLENTGLPIVKGVLVLRKMSNHAWALYPRYAKNPQRIIVLSTSRNRVLHELEKEGLVTSTHAITNSNSSIHYGWEVPFRYQEHTFCWTWDGAIRPTEEDKSCEIQIPFNADKEQLLKTLATLLSQQKEKLDKTSL